MTRRSTPPKPDVLVQASDAAAELGHKTMRTGRTIGCWHCSSDGIVGPDGARIGRIFTEECKR